MAGDPAVVELATLLFLLVGLLQVADGIQGTSLGALGGMSDLHRPTTITLTACWGLALPAFYLRGFVLGFGAAVIWLGYAFGLILAAIALPLRFWRLTAAQNACCKA